MKFFIDTNIIISAALFPNGKTAFVFSHILESHDIIISDYTIEECRLIFQKKFPDKLTALNDFLGKIQFTLFKNPRKIDEKKFPHIRDKKDLPILAAAILSDADILITGDKDFDDISIKRPLIFSPTQYFDLINK